MSLTNPDKVVTEQRLSEFYGQIFPYLGGTAEAGFTPVGTVIAVMGNSAPANYLACNGQVVNIADYPVLADYFFNQFGSKNKFGGDGTTTFGIPDLRGEFLRGTGTNGHYNQGDGAAVGSHQNATNIIRDWVTPGSTNRTKYGNAVTTEVTDTGGWDSVIKYGKGWTESGDTSTGNTGDDSPLLITTRPTNTSVLYCIATKNIFLNPAMNFSTTECVVGQWIDGKSIYQKTFVTKVPNNSNGSDDTEISLVDLNPDIIIDVKGICRGSCQVMGTYNNHNATITSSSSNITTVWVNDRTFAGDPNKLRIRNYNSTNVGNDAWVTIKYTKVTD